MCILAPPTRVYAYHLLPQLLAGLDKSRAEGLFLAPPEEFHMISQGGCVAVSDEVDDAQVKGPASRARSTEATAGRTQPEGGESVP